MHRRDVEAATQSVLEAVLHPEMWSAALATVAHACRSPLALAQIAGPHRYSGFANPGGDSFIQEYIKGGWHLKNREWNAALPLPGLASLAS